MNDIKRYELNPANGGFMYSYDKGKYIEYDDIADLKKENDDLKNVIEDISLAIGEIPERNPEIYYKIILAKMKSTIDLLKDKT